MSFIQKFVTAVFPNSWVEKLEKDSHEWRVHCRCGHSHSLWDLGGIRGPKAGNSRWRRTCEKCGERSWQIVSRGLDSR